MPATTTQNRAHGTATGLCAAGSATATSSRPTAAAVEAVIPTARSRTAPTLVTSNRKISPVTAIAAALVANTMEYPPGLSR